MKRIIALVMACLLCFGLLSVAANAEEPSVLNIGLYGQPANLDAMMTTDDLTSEVTYGSVYEKLVAFTVDNEVIPELCESWEISEGNTVYTYALRQGVLFHNGEEMTADDVVASMNRWLDNASAPDALVGGARFEKVDDYTVSITMENGTLYLNEMIAGLGQQAAIMPASVIEAVGEGELVAEYVGTGPYKYAEWPADCYIKLVPFEDYQPYGTPGDYSGWGGYKEPYFDEVYFYFPGDASALVNGMLTGEFDLLYQLSANDFSTFEDSEDFSLISGMEEMPMLIFNKSEGVASNAVVRQAVQAAINCDDVLYGSTGSEDYYALYSCYMFENSLNWYTEAGSEYYNQNDPERARELFEEAGWDFDSDVFRILVRSDATDAYTQAQIVQAELIDAGIQCELIAPDSATYSSVRNEQPGEWDAFITSFGPKVMPGMNLFLQASWAGWCTDERIQSDLAAISTASDIETARQIWADLQEYMYAESVPVVKFGATQISGACSNDFTGALIKERLVWVDVRPVA